ncbi:disease resistance-like protein DSC1 [Mangifera indica]|uniref:disease resistance-like protein DSC1 n=1 Tax=Mangifera indica TaxID=29780 RepID=UPI001CFA6D5E|nr:disease resistance-like protein DSC1 [Mangifera indica]
MSKIRDLQLSFGAFANMSNLRLLKFYTPKIYKVFVNFSKVHLQFEDFSKVHLPHCLKYLLDELRYLHWEGYPLKRLPSKFNIKKLVELKLPYSKVEQLWKGTKVWNDSIIARASSTCTTFRCKELQEAPIIARASITPRRIKYR